MIPGLAQIAFAIFSSTSESGYSKASDNFLFAALNCAIDKSSTRSVFAMADRVSPSAPLYVMARARAMLEGEMKRFFSGDSFCKSANRFRLN